MPLYVYQCRRCDVRTEVLQRRMDAPHEAVCEACGSVELERVYSAFATYRSELDILRSRGPGAGEHTRGGPDAPFAADDSVRLRKRAGRTNQVLSDASFSLS